MSWAAALADLLDPDPDNPNAEGVEPFYCWRHECDGMPHEGFPYRHARWKQHPPDDLAPAWFIWFLMAGRGFGKTRTGAEWMVDRMHESPPNSYFGAVAPTIDDGRDILVEGESGLLYVLDRRKIRHHWNRTLGQLDILSSGSRLETFTDQKPDGVRGPNLTAAWIDEPASFVNGMDKGGNPGTFSNLLMTLRKGTPKLLISGTPKATKFVKMLLGRASYVTRGHSDENRDNLADAWYDEVIEPLRGTAMGAQELAGEILEQAPGALWRVDWLFEAKPPEQRPVMVRVGHDPAVTHHEGSDAHGIVITAKFKDGNMYVLEDLSGVMTGRQAALRVVQAAVKYGAVVHYEPNQGGTVWEELYDNAAKELGERPPRAEKYTSVKSKEGRAQPLSQISERQAANPTEKGGLYFACEAEELRLEMTTWVPGQTKDSPDRLDALVLSVMGMLESIGTASTGMAAASKKQAAPKNMSTAVTGGRNLSTGKGGNMAAVARRRTSAGLPRR